jgi:hypothetical protein
MMRWIQIVLHSVLGMAAIAAGQAFVRDPSGHALGMEPDYLDGSPFPDFRFPGLFLAVVIGGTNIISAFALFRRSPFAPYVSLITGLLLVAWIGVQTAIIGFRHWSQAIWWVTFALVALIGSLLVHRAEAERGSTVRWPR